ncbi:serine hydrolase domain-containing protein [Chitinophaga filiformis]|uniref:Beta-lactamase family protein n=1 Tax=Chitinophaga filiformis TaxID=104663 RepID=A0ABY4I5D9_CHIFI|nr:serine hydrolase domain-containing protein [Chitinophaga filiformis]UPK69971.1 beta-lactamase family protein [Chitinophaga filiformis]
MKRFFLLTMLTVIVLLACSADDTARPPASGGKYDFSAVDRYIEDNLGVYNNHIVVLISRNGELIYHKEINMTANTNFPIASASKWLSAAVIMSLVDDRKLVLDDSVGRFLPVFSQYGKGGITIRQLFSHTAGFAGDENATNLRNKYEYRRNLTLAQAVDSIAVYTPLANTPGAAFSYGSTSMQIAGRIAEIVSGKSWQVLFNEKIGKPCEMNAVYSTTNILNPLIAGGVHTTANDYLNFLEMLENKGRFNGRQVLSTQAIDQMMKDQTNNAVIRSTPYPANPFATYPLSVVRYGIGNWLDVVDASGHVQESSSPGLFGTHPWQDTRHHLVGIIFTRTSGKKSNQVSLRIRQMVRDIVDKG